MNLRSLAGQLLSREPHSASLARLQSRQVILPTVDEFSVHCRLYCHQNHSSQYLRSMVMFMVRADLSSLPPYVPGLLLPGALKLASNEASWAPLPSVAQAIAHAASGVNRYPDMAACGLREHLAQWLTSQLTSRLTSAPTPSDSSADSSGTAATTESLTRSLTWRNIAVGNGSSALCLQAVQATCLSSYPSVPLHHSTDGGMAITSADPTSASEPTTGATDSGSNRGRLGATPSTADEVIFPWRSFEAYPILTRVAGAVPVPVPLTADGGHDLPAMVQAISEHTRLIFICNPNNPTGTTITSSAFRAFMRQVPTRVHVVLDEAYTEFDTSGTSPSVELLAEFPNLAVCRTFSKAHGLAGLRLGYMAGSEEFIEAVNKVGVPFGVNAIAQAAGVASINAEAEMAQRVQVTIQQRTRVAEALGGLALPSEANFLWLPVGQRAKELDAALKKQGIVVRCFAGEGLRVTVTDEAETDTLLQALGAVQLA